MTQKMRNIIANVFLGLSALIVVVFLARQFMAPPRPTWTKDYVGLGMFFAAASMIARGLPRRRAVQKLE